MDSLWLYSAGKRLQFWAGKKVTARACQCVSQSLYLLVCRRLLSGLAGKGKSAVSNDDTLVTTMYGLHKQTQRHLNTYLSLGQLNALDVREY